MRRSGKGSGLKRWRGSWVDDSAAASVLSVVVTVVVIGVVVLADFEVAEGVADLMEDVALFEGCARELVLSLLVILTAANIKRAKLR